MTASVVVGSMFDVTAKLKMKWIGGLLGQQGNHLSLLKYYKQ